VIKLHSILKQNASLHSVGKKAKSFGDIVGASADGGNIHRAQYLTQGKSRANSVGIRTDVINYERFAWLTYARAKLI
jgi:hypothetical protein